LPFPKAVDEHKPGKPLVPNGYGIYYALACVCCWFILVFFEIRGRPALLMATSVLFGSTMGLFDYLADLKWRYKVVLPIFAALPYVALSPTERTTIGILGGSIDLGGAFVLLLVPVMVTVVTNSYNQLGGLNGLEAGSGLIVLCGVALAHPEGELEDLAEDVGFDFLDMSDSATGSGAQSAGGGIRAPVYQYRLPHSGVAQPSSKATSL
jgi:UDP-N-acetylmuramyl pentapeptide phosphotransferase/UDP-N-acetylglucosamine-1-phosphate transferase